MKSFDAARLDGLPIISNYYPVKSNWSRSLIQPPFLAYPLIGVIVYTFGGIATNHEGEVLNANGPIPGLYAAGDITENFFGTAPNAIAMLRALVFGWIAGQRAVSYCKTRMHKYCEAMNVRDRYRCKYHDTYKGHVVLCFLIIGI